MAALWVFPTGVVEAVARVDGRGNNRAMDNKRTSRGGSSQGAGRASSNHPSTSRRATASEIRAQGRYARDRYAAAGRSRPRRRDAQAQDAFASADVKDAASRLSRDEYAKTHKAKRHGKAFYALIATLAVVLIGAGAAFAYVNVLSGNFRSGLGDTSKYLVKTSLTQPFYMLLMGTDGSAERDESGDFGDSYRTDSIMLARIDPVNKKVTLVSLHRDTMIDYGDEYGVNKLNAAHVFGGPELSVKTVSKLAGVDISHYAEINFDGFREIVDALGGVEVDVPMTIDDEDAGGHLDAGLQTLNGDQALILCRARHAYDEIGPGDEYRAANQRLVMAAIAKKLLSADVATMASTVQTLSKYVTTDLGVTDIIGLAQNMQGSTPRPTSIRPWSPPHRSTSTACGTR